MVMGSSFGAGVLGRSVAGLGLAAVVVGGGGVAFAGSASASPATAKSACRAAQAATAGAQHATDTYKVFADSSTVEGARADFATLVIGWRRAVKGARQDLAAPGTGSPKVLTAFLATFRTEDEVLARAASEVGALPTEARAFLDARRIMTDDILTAARATDGRLSRLRSAQHGKIAACTAVTGHERAFQVWRH